MTAADEREEAEAELESLRGLFAALDADGSGRLDDGELREALKALGVRLSPEEARYLLAQIDADGDGDISFEEFAAFVMVSSAPALIDQSKQKIKKRPTNEPMNQPANQPTTH